MPDCCSWLSRSCCCRRESQHTYIYLYNPRTNDGSSSPSLFRCLVCTIFGFCLTLILILTGVVIYHLNSNNASLKTHTDHRVIPMAKKRQLPDFVNTNIDPCENFYEFVCDKWTQKKKVEKSEDEYEQKWTRIRHRMHDTLMVNISKNPSISNESNFSSSPPLSVYKLYQLCEIQSPSLLIDEFERHIARFVQLEPYRSHLTLFNKTKSTNLKSSPMIFQHNPFFQILHPSSNQSYSTIIRINHRPFPSPLVIFSNLTILNQTALTNLIKFNNDYKKFLQEASKMVKVYEQEYNQDSLIIRRILTFSDYHICLSSLNKTNGLQNLIQLLNHFLQYRLRQYNIKLMDKQIRILEKITDNHTLVEHLKRIRLEFKVIEQIIPLQKQSIEKNTSCIINLLDKLLDKRLQLNELPSSINLYIQNTKTVEYFISNDWPYLVMLYERLLKKISPDTLINFVFYDYYRKLIYPYYQPHLHHLNDLTENSNLSCPIKSCFDILNCYHPSLLNQIIDAKNEISLEPVKIIVQNLINRFRLLIEQSDNLFAKEKNLLINELNQLKILLGHYSTTFPSFPRNLNSSSYLDYVQSYSLIPYDEQEHSYSIEPIYSPSNHTLFLPYGFIYLTNNSIEYSLIKIFLKIFSQSLQSNPFYIECLIKSMDDFNTTMIDNNDEHITYLLFRSKVLFEENINLDEYLWPFMSANSLMKQFLINYTADNYCQNLNSYDLFHNNTYLFDDIYLVFHCQQASSIKQSKCTVN